MFSLVLALVCWLTLTACNAGPICACSPPAPPREFTEPATSEQWAQGKLGELRGKHVTSGLLFSKPENPGYLLTSGANRNPPDNPQLYKSARDLHIKNGVIDGTNTAFAWHVEGKTAYLMHRYKVDFSILVINHPDGPCEREDNKGCLNLTAHAIPVGATLVVWWGDANADPPIVKGSLTFHNDPEIDDDEDKKRRGKPKR